MADAADFTLEQLPGGDDVIRFTGRLAIAAIGDLDDRLRALGESIQQIDLSQIDHIDTVGAWLVYRTAKEHDAKMSARTTMRSG